MIIFPTDETQLREGSLIRYAWNTQGAEDMNSIIEGYLRKKHDGHLDIEVTSVFDRKINKRYQSDTNMAGIAKILGYFNTPSNGKICVHRPTIQSLIARQACHRQFESKLSLLETIKQDRCLFAMWKQPNAVHVNNKCKKRGVELEKDVVETHDAKRYHQTMPLSWMHDNTPALMSWASINERIGDFLRYEGDVFLEQSLSQKQP